MSKEIYGRSPREIDEDHILDILSRPDFNVSMDEAVRLQIQRTRINVWQKEIAMQLIEMEWNSKEYRRLFRKIYFQ